MGDRVRVVAAGRQHLSRTLRISQQEVTLDYTDAITVALHTMRNVLARERLNLATERERDRERGVSLEETESHTRNQAHRIAELEAAVRALEPAGWIQETCVNCNAEFEYKAKPNIVPWSLEDPANRVCAQCYGILHAGDAGYEYRLQV